MIGKGWSLRTINVNGSSKLNDCKDLTQHGDSDKGKGIFTSQIAFQEHPLLEHSSFESTYFNGDNQPDFIVTTCDNDEYMSSTKPYHGIRINLNQGGAKFKDSLYLSLNGAFLALAGAYTKGPRESFVYFENNNGTFTANTFRACISERWLTMDADDVDSDGDIDLALGNYMYGPGKAIFVPEFLKITRESSGPPVMTILNTLR